MAKGKAVKSKGPKVSAIKRRNISQTKASNKRRKATGKAKNKFGTTQIGNNASGANLGNLGSDGEDVEEEVVPDDMVDDDHLEYLETMGQNISFVTDTLEVDENKEERSVKKRRKMMRMTLQTMRSYHGNSSAR
ncbi:Nucleolar complex protein 3 [Branchiostoma belcheri]|nr:Nucleolar complex protein 3 [Branchiostoma belcheri]